MRCLFHLDPSQDLNLHVLCAFRVPSFVMRGHRLVATNNSTSFDTRQSGATQNDVAVILLGLSGRGHVDGPPSCQRRHRPGGHQERQLVMKGRRRGWRRVDIGNGRDAYHDCLSCICSRVFVRGSCLDRIACRRYPSHRRNSSRYFELPKLP